MLFTLLFSLLSTAQAEPLLFPEVQNFKDVAEFAVRETRKETSGRDWLLSLNHELTQNGLKILARYRQRYTECSDQLQQLVAELPKIRSKKIEEILKRYHDGVGLAEAPQHCIYGRVYVVHPVVNLIRLEKGATAADRAEMIKDLEELLQYIPNLQKKLESETPKEN